MNKSYKTVWNETTGTYVAVPEMAKSRGKASKSKKVLAIAIVATGVGFALDAQAGALDGGSIGGANTNPGTIAYGSGATASSNTTPNGASTAVGANSSATGNYSTAYGSLAAALGDGSTALGVNASAIAQSSVAIGAGSQVLAGANNSVALGASSVADRANTVSVGSSTAQRQIVNVANGTQATDAATFGQLTNATRYFQASGLNDGTDNAHSNGGLGVAIGASALAANNGAATNGPVAIGANAYAMANWSGNDVTGHNPADTVAIGSYSTAGGAGAVALGTGANANFTNIAIGPYADASGGARNAIAIGQAANVTGWTRVALGGLANASGSSVMSLGYGSKATATNSVALGAGSTTTATLTNPAYNPGSLALSGTASVANGEVSIGSATKERRLTNLAAGSAATDAANVSQSQAEDATVDTLGANTSTSLGGGSTYNATTGAISAPSYALTSANSIAGTSGAATDVGTGFSKVDAALGTLNTTVTNINNGAGIK